MSETIHIAKASLRAHEGLRLKAYQCTADKTTIGYGRNLDDKGISTEEAELFLDSDIGECIQDLATFPYWNGLTDRRQAALIDLRFCLGGGGYRKFLKMGAALEAGDYSEAADQILDSRFAQQTGSRASDLALMIEEG
tara:strand:- start:64 stop:477 length:414 start_codon:yes stop_codon:yes gene_type:complete